MTENAPKRTLTPEGPFMSYKPNGERIARFTKESDRRLFEAALEMLNALKPFAALLHDHHARARDTQPIFEISESQITVGDLRRARAIINVQKIEEDK